MKKIVLKCMILCILLCCLPPQKIEAKTVQVVKPTNVVSDGAKIYYSIMAGDLKSYHIKTGKKTLIAKNEQFDGYASMGYHSFTLKGNYIYCINNRLTGTGGSLEYLYRIHRKTGKKEVLDCSNSYVIKNNWIYYVKNNIVSSTEIKAVGFYKMKLDGSKKTKVATVPTDFIQLIGMSKKSFYFKGYGEIGFSYYQCDFNKNKVQKNSKNLLFYDSVEAKPYEEETVGVKQGKTLYYMKNQKLYRKEQGKKAFVYPFSNVHGFAVLKNEVIVKTYVDYYEMNGVGYNIHLYYVKKNGKEKKILDRWYES